jgi:hypothetical protein
MIDCRLLAPFGPSAISDMQRDPAVHDGNVIAFEV